MSTPSRPGPAAGPGNSVPGPEPADIEKDDLGLTTDQWYDLQVAYNFGLLEPAQGTVEEQAFRRMDAFARQEAARTMETDHTPLPGPPARRAQAEPEAEPEIQF